MTTPSALPSGLDASFDGDGKATLERFGGDRSGMAVQADGKVIMVGGTSANFIMARFKTDGTLDDAFGDSGKVTTPIPGADALGVKEALAVAIQRDGKIVVAGDASTPRPASRAAIVLVRYDSNGSIDGTFGDGGFVFGPTFLFGRAFAVAIDSRRQDRRRRRHAQGRQYGLRRFHGGALQRQRHYRFRPSDKQASPSRTSAA